MAVMRQMAEFVQLFGDLKTRNERGETCWTAP
jgi:hypothetical protein